MKTPPFSKLLSPGSRPLIGTVIAMSGLDSADILCSCGFDWVFLDMEHGALSYGQAKAILQVVAGRFYVLARIAENTPSAIQQALDIGCDGVIVPLVNSKSEAEAVVRAAKYPPRGERSVGAGRAQLFGNAMKEYLGSANDQTTVIVQIEHRKAVEALDDILSVEGLDAVFIGPYDLSGSMNLLGQVAHEQVRDAIQGVRTKCDTAGMPYGVFGMTAEACAEELRLGAKYVAMGLDTTHLYNGARSQLERVLQNR
ncbi:MAG TPA: aldolase/citrate lyase family protein [Fimbriimonas sp.]|nr:aldolase/citrate lyase family protein [Fimbriimonas sp.]